MWFSRIVVAILSAVLCAGASFSAAAQAPGAMASHSRFWVRAYAEGLLPAGAEIIAPETYETLLETEMRKTLIAYLTAQGYAVKTDKTPDEGDLVLSYDAKTTEGRARRLPQSPVGVTTDPGAVARNDLGGRPVDPGFAPSIRFNRDKGGPPEGPSLELKIAISRGGEAVWTAYAAGDIGEGTRGSAARAVTCGMLAHLGEDAAADEAIFDHEAPDAGDAVESVECSETSPQ